MKRSVLLLQAPPQSAAAACGAKRYAIMRSSTL